LSKELENLNLYKESIWSNHSQSDSVPEASGWSGHQQYDESNHFSTHKVRSNVNSQVYGYGQSTNFEAPVPSGIPIHRKTLKTRSNKQFFQPEGSHNEFNGYQEFSEQSQQMQRSRVRGNTNLMAVSRRTLKREQEENKNHQQMLMERMRMPQTSQADQKAGKRQYTPTNPNKMLSESLVQFFENSKFVLDWAFP
jgi:hypothetical protein